MRGILITALTLALVTATLPGVSAETYRYVATGLPLGCQEDPLGTYDGICPGTIRMAVDGGTAFLLSVHDDVWGANAAYTACFEDANGDCLLEVEACGATVAEVPIRAVSVTVTFHPVLIHDDLSACGATTGEVTVDPVA